MPKLTKEQLSSIVDILADHDGDWSSNASVAFKIAELLGFDTAKVKPSAPIRYSMSEDMLRKYVYGMRSLTGEQSRDE